MESTDSSDVDLTVPNEAQTTLYELLGLDPTATCYDVKQAYRHYAKVYHPDKNVSPDATALFQRLISAYQTLTGSRIEISV